MDEPVRSGEADRLRDRSIGTLQLVFTGITGNGPALSVATSIVFLAAFTGPALPLAVLVAALAMLMVASSFAQLAKEIPSAGHTYTYVSRGIGPKAGFFLGWGMAWGAMLIIPLVFLSFAWIVDDVVKAEDNGLGWESPPWGVWVLAIAALVFALAYFDVRISATAATVLALVEVGIFVTLGIWMIASNAGENTLQVFNPRHIETGSFDGFWKGLLFAALALGGWDAAASYGEEARQPRRTIPRALILGSIAVGGMILFCAYATVVGTGFDAFTETTLASANPWRDLGEAYWGAGWVLIFLAIVNATVGAALMVTNFQARLLYAMGRNGVLPRAFARTHARRRTPHVSLAFAVVAGLAVALFAGSKWGGPLPGLLVVAAGVGILVALGWALPCAATMVFYWRERRDRFNPWLHGVFPAVGGLLLLTPVYYQYSPLPDYPARWATWFATTLFVLGLVVTFALARWRPHVLAAGERIFVDDEGRPAEPSAELVPADVPAASPLPT